jgi:phosphohistidine phosphatase SixA
MLRVAALLLFVLCAGRAEATDAGWALLRDGGHVVLLRHAMTDGTADPTNFDIANCRTQRKLSERGRQQARKTGALLAARAETTERILSSRYCRCLDTAKLAFEDAPVEPMASLDPPSSDPVIAKTAHDDVMKEIAAYSGSGNLIIVTHLENIEAWTGEPAREGEALIVQPQGDNLHVLGRVIFN